MSFCITLARSREGFLNGGLPNNSIGRTLRTDGPTNKCDMPWDTVRSYAKPTVGGGRMEVTEETFQVHHGIFLPHHTVLKQSTRNAPCGRQTSVFQFGQAATSTKTKLSTGPGAMPRRMRLILQQEMPKFQMASQRVTGMSTVGIIPPKFNPRPINCGTFLKAPNCTFDQFGSSDTPRVTVSRREHIQ